MHTNSANEQTPWGFFFLATATGDCQNTNSFLHLAPSIFQLKDVGREWAGKAKVKFGQFIRNQTKFK